MTGIFTVVSDSQSGQFRMKQKRAADAYLDGPKDTRQQLNEKTDEARHGFRLSPQQVRDAQSAITALEEAKRIGSPKAHAEQRMADVERRIQELRTEMRMAASRGDREKMMQLAREAAVLAREAGRSAKEFTAGVTAAAEMGVGAGDEITYERTETTLTIASFELKVEVRIGSGDTAPPEPDLPAEEGVPQDMLDLAQAALAMVQSGELRRTDTPSARDMVQRLMGDNAQKLARYKEADVFGRRVEQAVASAKNVINEAKIANESDEDERRRKERREEFKLMDEDLAYAEEAVFDLRRAAFGSGIAAEDIVGALVDITTGGEGATVAPIAPAAPAASVIAAPAPAVNMLA